MFALNDSGVVLGSSCTAGDQEVHATLWSNGHTTDLGTLGGTYTQPAALNVRGDAVGYGDTASGDQHGFIWHTDHLTDLGTLVGRGPANCSE